MGKTRKHKALKEERVSRKKDATTRQTSSFQAESRTHGTVKYAERPSPKLIQKESCDILHCKVEESRKSPRKHIPGAKSTRPLQDPIRSGRELRHRRSAAMQSVAVSNGEHMDTFSGVKKNGVNFESTNGSEFESRESANEHTTSKMNQTPFNGKEKCDKPVQIKYKPCPKSKRVKEAVHTTDAPAETSQKSDVDDLVEVATSESQTEPDTVGILEMQEGHEATTGACDTIDEEETQKTDDIAKDQVKQMNNPTEPEDVEKLYNVKTDDIANDQVEQMNDPTEPEDVEKLYNVKTDDIANDQVEQMNDPTELEDVEKLYNVCEAELDTDHAEPFTEKPVNGSITELDEETETDPGPENEGVVEEPDDVQDVGQRKLETLPEEEHSDVHSDAHPDVMEVFELCDPDIQIVSNGRRLRPIANRHWDDIALIYVDTDSECEETVSPDDSFKSEYDNARSSNSNEDLENFADPVVEFSKDSPELLPKDVESGLNENTYENLQHVDENEGSSSVQVEDQEPTYSYTRSLRSMRGRRATRLPAGEGTSYTKQETETTNTCTSSASSILSSLGFNVGKRKAESTQKDEGSKRVKAEEGEEALGFFAKLTSPVLNKIRGIKIPSPEEELAMVPYKAPSPAKKCVIM